jgi:hypothetical protein
MWGYGESNGMDTAKERPASVNGGRGAYRGEVVYLYAFDVAYELNRMPSGEFMGQALAQFWIDAGKRSPKQLFFYRPRMLRLPAMERLGPRGPVRVEPLVKFLPVGAISISVRVPFEVDSLGELVDFHDLRFQDGSLNDEVRRWAESIRRELEPYCVRPVQQLADEEAYTVFCLDPPVGVGQGGGVRTEEWLRAQRRAVAALLTQEPDTSRLSDQEASESTGRHLSYYEHDLVVVDWDAALVVDERRSREEVLHALELANVQLAELEAYDRILDDALDRSYRDLGQQRMRRRAAVLRELREIRIDLARLSDELSNITKFFGDWHLARVYEAVSSRFHLADWHRTIDQKLETLDDLYGLLQHDQINRWMLLLESTIVLLFVVDLVLLVMGLEK